MSFQDLLQQAGLSGFQQYFGDPTKEASMGQQVAQAFGFEGSQAEQFGQFFQGIDQQRILDAVGEIGQRQSMRTGQLYGDVSGQLGESMQQLRARAGQSGFAGAGSTQRQLGELRGGAQETLGRGLYGIEQQRGQEMSGVTGLLQNYLTSTLRRGEQISRLDPNAPSTYTPESAESVLNEEILSIMGSNPEMTYAQAREMAEQLSYRDRL
tara:strand:+ start:1057 stop:1686 length:630 start_codon:yes stop_codon:yes gene_type:complete